MYVYGNKSQDRTFIISDDKVFCLVVKGKKERFDGFFKVVKTTVDGTGRDIRLVAPYLDERTLHPHLIKFLRYQEDTKMYRWVLTAILRSCQNVNNEVVKEASNFLLMKHCAIDKCRSSADSCNKEVVQPVLKEYPNKAQRLVKGLLYTLRDKEELEKINKTLKATIAYFTDNKYWEKCNRFYVPYNRSVTLSKNDKVNISTKEGIVRGVPAMTIFQEYTDKVVGADVGLTGVGIKTSKILFIPSNHLL